MSDTRTHFSNGAFRGAKSAAPSALEVAAERSAVGSKEVDPGDNYFAISPNGMQILIPKELFIALSDFIKTRKCPGSISIQFRGGEIICVEAIAKKTYRSNA